MKYFGTDLETHGHYIFDLDDYIMYKIGLNFRDLPFNPEELTNNLPKGEVVFYQGGKHSAIGISGSCYDTRQGTKSIFWVDSIITFEQLKETILETPISKRIIDAMDFKINW